MDIIVADLVLPWPHLGQHLLS